MFGILCNATKETAITESLFNIYKHIEEDIPFIVFSLPNTNLTEKTVYGSLISKEKITPIKTALPPLIFNFAIHHSKSDVKKFRALMEVEGISIVNQANSFNQWTIMEMLSSNAKTKGFILPYSNFNKSDVTFDFSKLEGFIVKPENGANFADVIYGRQTDAGFDLYNWHANQYCHLYDIQSAISPIIKSGRWVFIQTPDLLTYANRLFVVRGYLQKNFDGDWELIHKVTNPKNRTIYDKLDKKIDSSMIQTINCINCFIPDLGICFVDFLIGMRGMPYFLDFGGWDSSLLGRKQNRGAQVYLCKNIMEYARSFEEKRG